MSTPRTLLEAMQPFVQGTLPVNVSPPEAPVRITGRWEITEEKHLRKVFPFLSLDERNVFLHMTYQMELSPTARPMRVTSCGREVTVELGIEQLLIELDRAWAMELDAIWKDAIHSMCTRSV